MLCELRAITASELLKDLAPAIYLQDSLYVSQLNWASCNVDGRMTALDDMELTKYESPSTSDPGAYLPWEIVSSFCEPDCNLFLTDLLSLWFFCMKCTHPFSCLRRS